MRFPRMALNSFLAKSLITIAGVLALLGMLQWTWLANASAGAQRWLLMSCAAVACLLVTAMAALAMRRRDRDKDIFEIQFQSLLEAAPDALIITNLKGIILLANSRTEELFGYEKEELQGQPVESLFGKAAMAGQLSS